MKSYDVMKLGMFRNSPRFYKQGRSLGLAGFTPGCQFSTQVVGEKSMVVLRVDTTGDRTVSAKGDNVPVIDINSGEVLAVFAGMDRIRVVVRENEIVLLALATEERRLERLSRLRSKLESGQPLKVGSTSHGAGVLTHALHAGLREKGVLSELSFANEIEPLYIDQAQSHNDVWSEATMRVCAPIQELVFDDLAMQEIGKVDVIEAGLPCTAASLAGRAKKAGRGQSKPEDDPQVGHLMVAFLVLVARTNPAFALLENVVPYSNTSSMSMFRSTMLDLGYVVHETTLPAREFGVLENRTRMVAVAVTKGISFSFDTLERPADIEAVTVGDLLDPVPLDDPSWSPMEYLKKKEVLDQQKKESGRPGTWFARQEVHASDTTVPTLTRGYNKRRSTDPMLVHPENPELLRLFTPAEAARLKGAPPALVTGMGKARAHEVLGQSVAYPPFVAVGKALGSAMLDWLAGEWILKACKGSRKLEFGSPLAVGELSS